MLPDNPFFTSSDIPDDFLCRRKDAEQKFVALTGGANIVLAKERGAGKTTFLRQMLRRDDVLRGGKALYVNLQDTTTQYDFLVAVRNALDKWNVTDPEIGDGIDKYIHLADDAKVSGQEDYAQELAVDGARWFLAALQRHCPDDIVAFDEFQAIERYPCRMAAVLRSKIQFMSVRFIYAGSDEMTLYDMFGNYDQPFFHSSVYFNLERIPIDDYVNFCKRMFSLYGAMVDEDAVQFVYELLLGHLPSMQMAMAALFSATRQDRPVGKEDARDAICALLDKMDGTYVRRYSLIEDGLRSAVDSVGEEGAVSGPLPCGNAWKLTAGDSPFLTVRNNVYVFSDAAFGLWIARKGGCLESRFANASRVYLQYTESLKTKMPAFPFLQ